MSQRPTFVSSQTLKGERSQQRAGVLKGRLSVFEKRKQGHRGTWQAEAFGGAAGAVGWTMRCSHRDPRTSMTV